MKKYYFLIWAKEAAFFFYIITNEITFYSTELFLSVKTFITIYKLRKHKNKQKSYTKNKKHQQHKLLLLTVYILIK